MAHKITVTYDCHEDNYDVTKKSRFIAYIHKKTYTGKKVLIYEIAHSPVVAKNRLLNLLGI
jgi:hypothetical protein